MLEKTIWHDRRDWVIRRTWEGYVYRTIDSDKWMWGVPPGMTILDAALLFESVFKSKAVA